MWQVVLEGSCCNGLCISNCLNEAKFIRCSCQGNATLAPAYMQHLGHFYMAIRASRDIEDGTEICWGVDELGMEFGLRADAAATQHTNEGAGAMDDVAAPERGPIVEVLPLQGPDPSRRRYPKELHPLAGLAALQQRFGLVLRCITPIWEDVPKGGIA
eukprot:EG_transcript_28513